MQCFLDLFQSGGEENNLVKVVQSMIQKCKVQERSITATLSLLAVVLHSCVLYSTFTKLPALQ